MIGVLQWMRVTLVYFVIYNDYTYIYITAKLLTTPLETKENQTKTLHVWQIYLHPFL